MIKHIIKHSAGLDDPVVFCGRIANNTIALDLRSAVMGNDKEVCQNCIKAVVKKLNSKLM